MMKIIFVLVLSVIIPNSETPNLGKLEHQRAIESYASPKECQRNGKKAMEEYNKMIKEKYPKFPGIAYFSCIPVRNLQSY